MISFKYSKKFLITVISPLIFGSLLYILFRKNNIIFIEWLKNMNLHQNENLFFLIQYFKLPKIIIYSLPDGLWTFSLINFILIIWKYNINRHSILWLLIAILISLMFELGQLLNYVKGTFDYIDLLFIIIAVFLSFILNKKQIKIHLYEN